MKNNTFRKRKLKRDLSAKQSKKKAGSYPIAVGRQWEALLHNKLELFKPIIVPLRQ